MKKLMLILLVSLTSTAFAAKKLIIADIKRFNGTQEQVIKMCHDTLKADARCRNSQFVCECSDQIAFSGMNIFTVEEWLEEPTLPAALEDELTQDTLASCTFVEVKRLGKDKFEVGRKHKEYADSYSTLNESKKMACDKAQRACEEDAYMNTRCVRSDRVTPGQDYADEDKEGDIIDGVIAGISIVGSLISLFN